MTPSEESETEQRCSACGGTRGEHEGRQHVFTTREGQLETTEQVRKREQQGRQAIPLSALGGVGQGLSTGRLIELLIEKHLITSEEALYIMGVGEKPPPKSGYLDPAGSKKHPFHKESPGAGY